MGLGVWSMREKTATTRDCRRIHFRYSKKANDLKRRGEREETGKKGWTMLYSNENLSDKESHRRHRPLTVTNTESDKGHNEISSDALKTNFGGKADSVEEENSIGGPTMKSTVSSGAPFVPANGGVESRGTILFIVYFPENVSSMTKGAISHSSTSHSTNN